MGMGFLDNVAGGALGQGVGSVLMGPMGGIAGGLSGLGSGASGILDSFGRKIDPKNRFKATAPTINYQANTPQNTFHADNPGAITAPTVNRADFAGALQAQMGQGGPDFSAANGAGANQRAFAQALGARGNTAYGQEQGLIGSLQAQAAGQGPGATLAQQLMAQGTQNNIAAGNSMIASQRGINPALAAREIAQNTASANQGAAAQGAQFGFQQQLAAQQQLGNMVGGDINNYTGATGNMLNTGRGQDINTALGAGGLSNQRLGILSGGLNTQNADISGTGIAAQQDTARNSLMTTGINAGVAEQNANLGAGDTRTNAAIAGQNAGNDLSAQGINSGVAVGNQRTTAGLEGGLINAGGGALAAGAAAPAAALAKGLAKGGRVPGTAPVSGDDPRNDIVDAKLSPGEIVVPRSAAKSPEHAMEFIKAIKKWKGGETASYSKVLQSKRTVAELQKRVAQLEKRLGAA